MEFSRRTLLISAAAAMTVAATKPVSAALPESKVSPDLLRQAREALQRHSDKTLHHDVIAIVDFSRPSCDPRFHLLDVASGRVTSYLVAHGRGSDPSHTGWLKSFSNEPGSEASSAGAYRTEDLYIGGHGRSMRLAGLDPSNSNALARAIVIHGAWYVSPKMAKDRGVLGRSQGCFALASSNLDDVLTRLGPGRMIYAGKA